MAHDDDADDGGGDERGAGRQGGRRLGGAELACARSAARSGSRSWARSSRAATRSPAATPPSPSCTASTTRCASARVLALAGAVVATLAIRKMRPARPRAGADGGRRGRVTARPSSGCTARGAAAGGARRRPAASSLASSYRGATTAEIAREAGITEPILYRHFGSKRDLYLACLDEAWRSFREVAEQAIAEDPASCLGAIADALHGEAGADPAGRPLDPGADRGGGGRRDREGAARADPRGARLLRRRDPRRPGRGASSTPTATRWPRRGSSSRGGLLATIDSRLGGLLGDDLAARAHRAPALDARDPLDDKRPGQRKSPGCGTRGSSLVRRGAGWASPEGLALRPSRPSVLSPRRSPCTRPGVRPVCKVRSL